eukprot:TRINITY_DN84550_c0_g1_i1.p1 TRINITY_DN84550_c0_g1~~TRINITY_DN84550_c0_g1_i1.p1  ORF type:complete len:758 (-),score=157.31 TRINITY_DN84550_c0_g1_i1:25-2298(-)
MGQSCGSRELRHADYEVREGQLFDVHCHYFDYQQKSEGMACLLKAMSQCNVSHAAIMGNPFKKAWVEGEQPPVHPAFDDGDLYSFSATDWKLNMALQALNPSDRSKLVFCACGLNLGDRAATQQLEDLIRDLPVAALGEIPLRKGLLTNLELRGAADLDHLQTAKRLVEVCARQAQPLPVIIRCNATSRRTWADRRQFQYLEEFEEILQTAGPLLPVLWVHAGLFNGGTWDGFASELSRLLSTYSNLHISITPDLLTQHKARLPQEQLLSLLASHPRQFMMGTMVYGRFQGDSHNKKWQEMSYFDQIHTLSSFAVKIKSQLGKAVADAIRFGNAMCFFRFSTQVPNLQALQTPEVAAPQTSERPEPLESASYGSGMPLKPKELPVPAPAPEAKQWKTVDCHFHLFDFSQKSCGTAASLRALDESCCEKAVLLSIGCCKKWNRNQKEKPLFYTDDNGPCYVYSYADQMLADAWLALLDDDRKRLAPMLAGFDPTDLNAINHVERMYEKYPRMWRGIGEVMCRHDDLTSTLMNKEVPRPNHPAMFPIYEFCCQKGLPILVHSNADRVGTDNDIFAYEHEVAEVLDKFPSLMFVWCHAGVSRRTSQTLQHELFDRMMTKYPNLHVDISWVVWEEVMLDKDGVVRDTWVSLVEKFCHRVTIGSDNTGQFWSMPGLAKNTLKSQIVKYWQLFDRLSPAAARRVAYQNGEDAYFANWDVPTTDDADARYHILPRCYPCHFLDTREREYVAGSKASTFPEDASF